MGLIEIGADPEVWAEVNPAFPGFEVKVRYLSPGSAKKINEQATSKQVNRRTRQMEDAVDNERYARLMVKSMVMDWRGLKLEHLEEMLPLTETAKDAVRAAGGEVPFSADDLEMLADNSYSRSFLDGVLDLATDLEAMQRAKKLVTEGNSADSPHTPATQPGPTVAKSATSSVN